MDFSLPAAALEQSYRLESYEKLESTNLLAAEFAANGDAGKLWITAEEQTRGRGRRGRIWQSPKGNLYATLLLVEAFSAETAAQLSFAAGLALVEALAAVLPPALREKHDIALKWPNDVLIDKAKLAGILVEYSPLKSLGRQAGDKAAILIGMGVNVAAAPEMPARPNAPSYPTVSLRRIGAQCSAADLWQALSLAWIANYRLWDNGRGMAAVRDKWLLHAAYKGEPIRLMRRGQPIDGIFETINAQGQLILAKADGEKALISAGDIYFGAIASADAGE